MAAHGSTHHLKSDNLPGSYWNAHGPIFFDCQGPFVVFNQVCSPRAANGFGETQAGLTCKPFRFVKSDDDLFVVLTFLEGRQDKICRFQVEERTGIRMPLRWRTAARTHKAEKRVMNANGLTVSCSPVILVRKQRHPIDVRAFLGKPVLRVPRLTLPSGK